ncbi:MAG: hypothetical protein AAFV93_01525 [Chloroflexota bacterium]
MSQDLKTAYNLIKEGQKQAAINMLEPMISANRDNEDAWWLLANATNDPRAKRNALNNILRLSENDSRRAKAQNLLKALNDDPYDFDVPADAPKMGVYEAIDETPQKKSGMNCATLSLIVVGVIGVCACISIFGLLAISGNTLSFVFAPETYMDGGQLADDETYTGTLDDNNPIVGFTLVAEEGDEITLTVESDSTTAPFIVIYEPDTNLFVTGTNGLQGAIYQPETFNNTLVVTFVAPEDDEYLVTLRGTSLAGNDFGFGDYTLDVEEEE